MCLTLSLLTQWQVHLQRNTLSSKWGQGCFFPLLHFLQPELLDGLLFCNVLLFQHRSILFKSVQGFQNMTRADAEEHHCFLMHYLSRQHAEHLLISIYCTQETALMLQLLLMQEGANLPKSQDTLLCYGRRYINSNNDKFWNCATF